MENTDSISKEEFSVTTVQLKKEADDDNDNDNGKSDFELMFEPTVRKRKPFHDWRNESPQILCLFCMHRTTPEPLQFPEEIPGAIKCSLFQKELQTFFILSQVLDIPSSWIRQKIKRTNVKGTGTGTALREWFYVCPNCFTSVSKAWKLYQNLLGIRGQLKEIKDKLKQEILESTKRFKSRIEGEMVREIRKYSRASRKSKRRPTQDLFFEGCSSEENDDEDDDDAGSGISFEDPLTERVADVVLVQEDRVPPLKTNDDLQPPSSFRERETDMGDDFDDGNCDNDDEDDGDGDADFVDDGAALSDDSWEMTRRKRKSSQVQSRPEIREVKVKGEKAGTSRKGTAPKKKRIRDRTKEKKRKRIWKKKPPKWPWRCDVCPAKYRLEDEFKVHKEAHERNKLNNRIYDCNFCHYPCDDEEGLEAHKYEKHLKSSHSRLINYRCKLCPFTIQFYYKLVDHAKKEHPNVSEEDCGLVPLTCKICSHKSGNVNAAIQHKNLMHPEIVGAKVEDSLLECKECGEKFDNAIRLKYHENAHIRQKRQEANYTCDICGKSFKWRSRLLQHYPTHKTEKEWMCSLCGLDFTRKNALDRHNERYHPQVDGKAVGDTVKGNEAGEYFECGKCGLQMPRAYWKRHMKSHKEEFQYKCDLCSRSYLKPQALRRHKNINHSNGEHNAKCEYCNKTFIHMEYVRCHYKYCHIAKTAMANNSLEKSAEKKSKVEVEVIDEQSTIEMMTVTSICIEPEAVSKVESYL